MFGFPLAENKNSSGAKLRRSFVDCCRTLSLERDAQAAIEDQPELLRDLIEALPDGYEEFVRRVWFA